MKTHHLLCLALVACSSSTTIVYQVLPDGGAEAGAADGGPIGAGHDADAPDALVDAGAMGADDAAAIDAGDAAPPFDGSAYLMGDAMAPLVYCRLDDPYGGAEGSRTDFPGCNGVLPTGPDYRISYGTDGGTEAGLSGQCIVFATGDNGAGDCPSTGFCWVRLETDVGFAHLGKCIHP